MLVKLTPALHITFRRDESNLRFKAFCKVKGKSYVNLGKKKMQMMQPRWFNTCNRKQFDKLNDLQRKKKIISFHHKTFKAVTQNKTILRSNI